jgi:hypothetical protein
MITQHKFNVMKVNAEFRLMRIKMFREQQEQGDNPPPIIVPPQEDSALRNVIIPEPPTQEVGNG